MTTETPSDDNTGTDPSDKQFVEGWQGRYYEDFKVEDIYKHPFGRTVTETDSV